MVTSIKDEGFCFGAWIFAIVAAAESTLILNGWADNSTDLSEQYLLACSNTGGCYSPYFKNI